MMSLTGGYDLRQALAFVVDSEGNMRRLLRGSLARLGMDQVEEFHSIAEVIPAFNTAAPDILFVDGAQDPAATLRFVQGIRNAQFQVSPFVCVVVVVWEVTQGFLLKFYGSGADDLLLKPFSAKQVADRIVNLVEARKPFVVTSDYVGPDRRKQPREGSALPLIDTPNSLREKVVPGGDRAGLAERQYKALELVDRQKVIRHGFQVAFLLDYALPGLCRTPPDKMAVEHLLRVPAVLEDLLRRLPPAVRGEAEGRIGALREMIARVQTDPTSCLDDTRSLRTAALALALAATGRSDPDVLEHEVIAAVTAYRKRLEQIAQAKAHTPPLASAPVDTAPFFPPQT